MNAWTACMPGITGMWVFPVMFFLIMAGMAIMVWRRGMMPGCGMMRHHEHETPQQILDRRYAGGELRKEQYDEMKRNLA
jgi:putative membrane protein